MATLVTFHAHPDDEAIATGGSMARAADEGHRVVLVVATKGELGEVAEGVLRPGESLSERRVAETLAAAEILGVSRVEFLGYRDSGMAGTDANHAGDSFWQADVDEAAARLAAILAGEGAGVLTIYDEGGVYGHPDHVQVHRVGLRAAEMAGTPVVYESTFDRDAVQLFMEEEEAVSGEAPPSDFDVSTFGTPGALITTRVDVGSWADRKRAAMAAHASQIAESSFFLAMPRERFVLVFGTEYYVRRGAPPGTRETWLFDSR